MRKSNINKMRGGSYYNENSAYPDTRMVLQRTDRFSALLDERDRLTKAYNKIRDELNTADINTYSLDDCLKTVTDMRGLDKCLSILESDKEFQNEDRPDLIKQMKNLLEEKKKVIEEITNFRYGGNLKPRKSLKQVRKSRKSRKQVRKSRKSRKQVRKSRKSRKQVRKSRKVVRKSRKSRKQVRRNRK